MKYREVIGMALVLAYCIMSFIKMDFNVFTWTLQEIEILLGIGVVIAVLGILSISD